MRHIYILPDWGKPPGVGKPTPIHLGDRRPALHVCAARRSRSAAFARFIHSMLKDDKGAVNGMSHCPQFSLNRISLEAGQKKRDDVRGTSAWMLPQTLETIYLHHLTEFTEFTSLPQDVRSLLVRFS